MEPMSTLLPAIPQISLETANKFYAWGWRASLAGAVVTAVGVVFLFWGTRVRDRNFEAQVGALNREAGEARERAGKLEERSAGLEKETETIRSANLGLQLNLEQERTERLKLEEKQKPRTIKPTERELLLACLARGARGPVTVVPKTFDNEAEGYAASLIEVLIAAGFEITPPTGPRPFGFGQAGIFAVINDIAHPPLHAGLIQSCLKKIDVDLGGGANPEWVKDPNLVIIAVGQKP
jgi:hypothetical protein